MADKKTKKTDAPATDAVSDNPFMALFTGELQPPVIFDEDDGDGPSDE